MEYKNTMRVDLPEVDFSFHEDTRKAKEMTAQGFPCPPSFPLTSYNFSAHKSGWIVAFNNACLMVI